jgi:hypothetical protein
VAATGLTARSPALATFGVLASTIIGGGLLALPVALARFGPLGAATVLLVIGLVNMVTIASIAGAAARSSAVTTGRGRLATVTAEHLGPVGAQAATISSILLWFGVLIVFGLGLATTLADVVGLRASTWVAAYLAIVLVLVLTEARQPFIATATGVVVLNLVLLAAMIAVVALNARWDLFTAGPLDSATDVSSLQVVFGTVLASYFGHTAVFSVAPEALRADPSGRALVRGATAAMGAAVVVNVLWVVVALSAVPPASYAADTSTGVGLLDDAVGGAIGPLSTVFVVLGMGVLAINAAFILGDTLVERLPRHRRLATVLAPGSWLEAYDAVTGTTLTITALASSDGVDLVARGRRGRDVTREPIVADSWDARELLGRVAPGRRGRWLRVHVDGDVGSGVMVRAETNLTLTEHAASGAALSALGGEGLRARLFASLVREPASPAQLAERLGERPERVADALDELERDRAVALDVDGTWRPVLGRRHRAKTAVVAALFDELTGNAPAPARGASWLETPLAHTLARGVPVALAMVVAIVLAETGTSFTSVLSLMAMATMVFLGGALPLLLGLSLQARAERAAARSWLTASRAVLWAFLALFVAVGALYLLVIYRDPIDRAVALGALVAVVGATWSARGRGAFEGRSTVALDVAPDGAVRVAALEAGAERAVVAPPRLPERSGELVVDVPSGLRPPVLLVALSEDVVPARLGPWRATTADGHSLAGKQEDPAGELLDTGRGALAVRWSVR